MPNSFRAKVGGTLIRWGHRLESKDSSSPGSSTRTAGNTSCVPSTLPPGLFLDDEGNRIGPPTLQERVYETAKEARTRCDEDDGDRLLCEFSKCASQLSGAYDLGVPLLTEGSPDNDKHTATIVARMVSEIGACPFRSLARLYFAEDSLLTRLVTDRWDRIDAAQDAANRETQTSEAGREVTSSLGT